MFDTGLLSGVMQILVGWAVLSCAAAGAWSIYRAPGRSERLAFEYDETRIVELQLPTTRHPLAPR
jgi:hypothetical protein